MPTEEDVGKEGAEGAKKTLAGMMGKMVPVLSRKGTRKDESDDETGKRRKKEGGSSSTKEKDPNVRA